MVKCFTVAIFFLPILFIQSLLLANENLAVTPKLVAERILSHSRQSKELQWSFDLSQLEVVKARSALDWTFSLETGYSKTKLEDFAGRANPQDESYTTKASVQRPFSTGTKLGLDFSRISQKSEYRSTSTSTVPDTQTQDLLGVSLEQNLLRNYFGKSVRSKIQASEIQNHSLQLLRNDQLQDLVLQGIRAFWNTYVAQENFKESSASRDRYEKLVEIVRRKNSLGYSHPGEFAQVQAELETRIQAVKFDSQKFIENLENFRNLLQFEGTTEIEFTAPKEVPSLPIFSKVQLNELRSIRSQKLKIESLEESLKTSSSDSYPDLSLIAKYSVAGLEETTTGAQSELWAGSRPQYYVGLRFLASFGAGTQQEEMRNKRTQKMIEESTLQRLSESRSTALDNAARKIQSLYSIAQSIKKQKTLREQAALELQKSYQQGRTDISILIEALNKFFTSQTQLTKSIGDYQIALNEWSALKDELIIETSKGDQK